MISRNQEQEICMKSIFAYRMQKSCGLEPDLLLLMQSVLENEKERNPSITADEVTLFIKEVVVKTLMHEEELLDLISKNLVQWTLPRINRVLISILLFSLGEATYLDDAPKAPIIDVAISLAKRYGDAKDYSFINAILDKLIP